jgi:similar to stage IV sporulation protein
VVLTGQPLVRQGDTVLAGQVLVSGVVPLYREKVVEETAAVPGATNGKKVVLERVTYPGLLGVEGDNGYLRADGMVRARVWYEGESRVPFAGEEWQPTGRVRRSLALVLGGRRVSFGPRVVPFAKYSVREKRHALSIDRKTRLPVEVIQLSYRELTRVTHHLGAEAARQRALSQAWDRVNRQYDRKVKVLDRRVSVTEDGKAVTARAIVECEEEIQVIRPVRIGDPSPAENPP